MIALVLSLILACGAHGAAVKNATEEMEVPLVDIVNSTLVLTIPKLDSSVFRKSVATLASSAPAFSPVLTIGVLSYAAYAALAMALPSVLEKVGLPIIELSKSSSSNDDENNLDEITTTLMKEIAGRSVKMEGMLEAAKDVLGNGASGMKLLTEMMKGHVENAREVIGKYIKAFQPECMLKHVCEAGQVTSRNYPMIGFLIRSMDASEIDEYSLALIAGTTLGDCSAVYHECDILL